MCCCFLRFFSLHPVVIWFCTVSHFFFSMPLSRSQILCFTSCTRWRALLFKKSVNVCALYDADCQCVQFDSCFFFFYLCWTQCTHAIAKPVRWSLKYYNTSTIRFGISMFSHTESSRFCPSTFLAPSLCSTAVIRHLFYICEWPHFFFFTLGHSTSLVSKPCLFYWNTSGLIALCVSTRTHHFTVCFTSRFNHAAAIDIVICGHSLLPSDWQNSKSKFEQQTLVSIASLTDVNQTSIIF